MGGRFESDEATVPRVRVPLLPVVWRLVLAFFAWATPSNSSTHEAMDGLTRWAAGDAFPVQTTISLLIRLFVLLAAGSALAALARSLLARPRVPRGAVSARVDDQGLHVGDRLIVARPDVLRADVATDIDLGFAVVVTTRRGATVRIPQRVERSARGLAEALAANAEPGALVFEGVSGGRSRQTRAAALAAASVVGTVMLVIQLGWMRNSVSAWRWFDGWRAEIPFTTAWWLDIACTFGLVPVGIALASALGPIARRARAGSVTVGPTGVGLPDRKLAREEIAGVEPGSESDVTLALRDGRHVRLAFGAERARVERDLFVARVRALTDVPTGEVTYPAAETSGVRVALAADAIALPEPEEEDVEAPARVRKGDPVSERFEAGEARVRVEPPALPIVRRVVLLLGVLWCFSGGEVPFAAIRNIVSSLVGSDAILAARYWELVVNLLALVTQVVGLLTAGSLAFELLRARRLRKGVPDRPVVVSADGAGLHADSTPIVARDDVLSAEVALDPDIGFVVLIRSRGGVTARVPLRSEADARALAGVLDPVRALDAALVFEGVSDGRWKETLVAVAAVVGAGWLAAARSSLDALGFWHWVDTTAVGFYEQPRTVMFWVVFAVAGLGMWAVVAEAVMAVRPLLRRLAPGRVAVDVTGVAVGDGKAARRFRREDIERVDADDSPVVKLALRDGRSVRLRFSADRAVVERDAFVARVRAMLTETPVETYSAAETSGVRVALEADVPVPHEEDADVEPQAPRARRR